MSKYKRANASKPLSAKRLEERETKKKQKISGKNNKLQLVSFI